MCTCTPAHPTTRKREHEHDRDAHSTDIGVVAWQLQIDESLSSHRPNHLGWPGERETQHPSLSEHITTPRLLVAHALHKA